MKEEKQNWKDEVSKIIAGLGLKHHFHDLQPSNWNDVYQFVENQRKQACQSMIEYMEEKAKSLHDDSIYEKDYGANEVIEAAKAYLKTL